MPPVAITSVMPTETMTIVATWVRFTLRVCQLAKFGVTAKLNAKQHDERGQRGVAPEEGGYVERGALPPDRRRVSH